MALLIIKQGQSPGRVYSLHDETVIGRSHEPRQNREKYINLEDEKVSRNHLRIREINTDYSIEDLFSTNGTCLDNTPLEPGLVYPLKDGDVIELGSTQLFFSQLETSQDRSPGREGHFELDGDETKTQVMPVEVLANNQHRQDVSLVVDASEFLMSMRVPPKATLEINEELVKRMHAMIEVSMALGAITSMDELMSKITALIFEMFETAERAFVITYDQKTERFHPLSLRYRDGEADKDRKIEVSQTIINQVLKQKCALLLSDVLGDAQYAQQASVVDLAIRSVMCAPLLYEGEVLGLVQVDTRCSPEAFSAEDLEVLTAICSQLAISLKNSQLFHEIEHLFEGFVRASVQAIEARDPSTAGHSFRVADYTENLAIAVDRTDGTNLRSVNFSREQLRELRYAALLHDFGKVGVREHVLTKAKKLYPHQLQLMQQRFKYAQACLERRAYQKLIERHSEERLSHTEFAALKRRLEQELEMERRQLRQFYDTIVAVNEPECHDHDIFECLSPISDYRFRDMEDDTNILLDPFEFSVLSGARGSLNPEERQEIESHVSHTYEFLRLIPWTKQFTGIPDIAHAHHERLDGSGYPRGLSNAEIPVQAKIMAIADVYDALTAGDRPYRKGLNSERALQMIEEEVRVGKLDEGLFNIFVESRAYLR